MASTIIFLKSFSANVIANWKVFFPKDTLFCIHWILWWHNWIKSIIKNLWEDFKRIKIGIGYDSRFEVSDWVLSKFNEEELIDLENDVFKETNNILIKNF